MKKRLFLLIFLLLIILIIFWLVKSLYIKGGLSAKYLGSLYPAGCYEESFCDKDIVGIDCGVSADGPYYFINKKTRKIIKNCGGYAPPKECSGLFKQWNCRSSKIVH